MNKVIDLLLLFVAIILAVGVVSGSADAAVGDEFEQGDFTYEVISDEEVAVLNYNGSSPHIEIPDTVTYDGTEYRICELNNQFNSSISEDIVSIHLPRYLDNFSEANLDGFGSLETITVSENNIWFYAKDGVLFEKHGSDAYLILCPVMKHGEYVIPDEVVKIGTYAFEFCDYITSITLSKNVTEIEYLALNNMDRLKNVLVPEENLTFSSYDGVLYDDVEKELVCYPQGKEGATYTVRSGTDCIGDYSFFRNGYLLKVVLPESVTEIGYYAFGETEIASINLPAALTYIGTNAFTASKIVEMSIPGGVKNLQYTFEDCRELKRVTLCEGVETIVETFTDCVSLEYVSIPSTLETIEGAFTGCESLKGFDVAAGNPVFSDHEGVLYDIVGKTLISYPGKKSDETYTVEAGTLRIEKNAFNGNTHIERIVLPDGLVTIDDGAFDSCYGLTSVNIPSTVTELGEDVFNHCPIESITIPGGIKDLNTTFKYNNALKNVVIEEGVETLYYTFIDCGALETIVIPSTVTYIEGVFSYCTMLKSITVDDDNTVYKTVDGVLFTEDGTELIQYPSDKDGSEYIIPDGVVTIKGSAFHQCINLRSITIPASVTNFDTINLSEIPYLDTIVVEDGNEDVVTINGVLFSADRRTLIKYLPDITHDTYTVPEGTVNIGDNAFEYNTHIKEVILPGSLRTIGDYAFQCCINLESVTFNEGLTDIGEYAFQSCICLKDITLPQSLEDVDAYAFEWCHSLKDVTIPAGVKDLVQTFYGCMGLESATILGATSVFNVFAECVNLSTTSLPDTLESVSIGPTASLRTIILDADNPYLKVVDGVLFSKDGKELIHYPPLLDHRDYTIPEGVEYVYNYAFTYANNLETLVFASTVDTLGYYCIYYCESLVSVTLNTGLVGIEDAFYDCDSLISINIPEGVEWIHSSFADCGSLRDVIIPASVTYIDVNSFDECHSLRSITVDANNQAFKSIDGVLFTKDGKTLLKYPAMSDRDTYTVPDGVTVIEENSFEGMLFLKHIDLPSSLEDIGDSCFEDAVSLLSITIPDYVEVFDEAFEDCHALVEAEIGKGVSLWSEAFKYCRNLKKVTFVDPTYPLDNEVFEWCTSLEEIVLSVNNIEYKVVDGVLFTKDGTALVRYLKNEGRTEYTIPEGTIRILDDAFQGCYALRKIVIPDTVIEIENGAIRSCTDLETIVVDADNRHYKVVDGVLFTKDGKELLLRPAKSAGTEYTIPDGVVHVYDNAFEDARYLKVLNIPKSVTYIYITNSEYTCLEKIVVDADNRYYRSIDGLLYDHDVTDLILFPGSKDVSEYTLPKTVIYVEESALTYCYNIERFLVEDGNPIYHSKDGILYDGAYIIAYPLARSGDAPYIPNDAKELPGAMFAGSDFTVCVLPDSIEYVGSYLFQNSSVRSVTLGDRITYLEYAMFRDCKDLRTVKITADSNMIILDNNVFKGCENVRLVSGIDGYELKVYYDSAHTKEFDTSDEGFSGILYLEWTEMPNDTVPMVIGFSIGAVLLAGAFVALYLRGRN